MWILDSEIEAVRVAGSSLRNLGYSVANTCINLALLYLQCGIINRFGTTPTYKNIINI